MASSKKTAEAEAPNDKQLSSFQKMMASDAISSIKKKYGGTSVMKASDERMQVVNLIPTSIFPLDLALGGGFQAGRVHTAYGNKSSSKTTMLLKMLSSAQKQCASCFRPTNLTTPDGEVLPCGCKSSREMVAAFIDVEGTFDEKWARRLGVDTDRLMIYKSDHGEEALDVSETLIRSGNIDILILDSLAFLVPTKEIEESVEKDLMGVQPRLIGKGVRKLNAALSSVKNELGTCPTIFFTNQIRMKLGVMFGNPETTPGGNAPGFVSTSETKLWAGKYDMDEVTGRPNHVDVNFRVEKNKTSPPKMEGTFRLILTDNEIKKMGDIQDEDTMVKVAEKCGLVEGGGSSWRCMGEQFGGKSLIEKKLMTDPFMKAKLREALFKIMLT